MITTTLGIEGMACGMCEAHINDAIRRNFSVKRVKSNRRKKTCVVVSEEPLDEARVRAVIGELGYDVVSYSY
ncbi:MAG: heavy-metal-associated domain-containing protein [Coriobacteriales bacterium]|nr:heavy-metal-associated domain-containing protein [Coriobacteriales bacterium]